MKLTVLLLPIFCLQVYNATAQIKSNVDQTKTSSKERYTLVGTIIPPMGMPKGAYSIAADFQPQVQLTQEQLIVRSWSDTSLHVFNLSQNTIRFAQKLPAPMLVEKFGFARNIVTNGIYIAVSDERGHGNDYVKDYNGSVYIYRRNNGNWVYHQTIKSPNKEYFARRLAITDSLLLIDNMNKSSIGSDGEVLKKTPPMLYRLAENGKWQLKAPLPLGLANQDHLRTFPLLAQDGSLIVAKDHMYETYRPAGGSYQLIQRLSTNKGIGFSMATALSPTHLLTKGQDSSQPSVPSLQLYTRQDQKLSLEATIKVEQPGMNITSLAMDGELIAIGLISRSPSTSISPVAGRVLLYRKIPKVGYTLFQTIYPPDSYRGDRFGVIVLLKGNRLVIVSEAGTGNYRLKRMLAEEKDQQTIARMKTFGDIYLYHLSEFRK